MSTTQIVRSLQEAVWAGSLPLEIILSPSDSRVYDKTEPYYIHCPRLSYLPFLFDGLHAFFQHVLIDPLIPPSSAWFSFEGVPLKWHHPLGLLYDLFSGATPAASSGQFSSALSKPSTTAAASSPLPWRLFVHYSAFPTDQLVQLDVEGKALHDAFINSVKEADFLRNGSANAIMKLNINDSTTLWQSVIHHKVTDFAPIYARLVPSISELRHIPLRVYLPSPEPSTIPSSPLADSKPAKTHAAGHLRVVQTLVQPYIQFSRDPQTLGSALNAMLPTLFPSRRRIARARPVLHGAVVPLDAVLEELMRGTAYADGWLSFGLDVIV